MKTTFITGGAGFIGAHLADRLLGRGESVRILDNLERDGSAQNLEWLRKRHGEEQLEVRRGDVRDAAAVDDAVGGTDWVVHLAGQVAVTSSLVDPRNDFENNAVGAFNIVDAVRRQTKDGRGPALLYASTNKVYGDLARHALVEKEDRWSFRDLVDGVAESEPVDPHSPYGCSKAVGDLYARDAHRIFGVRSVVLRQSCIYGARQHGIEDQGWVSWLVRSAFQKRRVRVFGDGKQVRDLLWIDDLLDLYDACFERADTVAGEVFNVGGGLKRSLSVWGELGPLLEKAMGRQIETEYHPWRPGDQRVFVCDLRKARSALDWTPQVTPAQGVERMIEAAKEPHDG